MPQQNYSEKKSKPPVLCTSLYLVSLSFGIGALLIHSGAPWLRWVETEKERKEGRKYVFLVYLHCEITHMKLYCFLLTTNLTREFLLWLIGLRT